MKRKAFCPHCHKYLIAYTRNSDLCQICYRKLLDEYSYYNYKNENKKPRKGTISEKICEEIVKNSEIKNYEVAEKLNTSLLLVSTVRQKYLCRCNGLNQLPPEYFRK